MTQSTTTKLQLFLDNYDKLKNNFRWEQNAILALSAILITNDGKVADVEKIESCRANIKQSTPLFSVFRGKLRFTFACILSLSENPKALFNHTLEVYELLRRERFISSDYLAASAINIANQCDSNEYPYIIGRMTQFYDAMKSNHRFLTHDDDYCYASMLAMTDLNVSASTTEIETMYGQLKPLFGSSNGLQSLTHVLAIGSQSVEEKIQKTKEIYQAFKNVSYNFNSSDTMSSLGVAVLLCDDFPTLASQVAEVSDALSKVRGFGSFTYNKKQRGLLAFSLVVGDYADKLSNSVITTTLTNSITNILIAQQTAMMIATTTAISASAMSNS